MSMSPIPPDVLEAAMNRIRAGETFTAVRDSLNIGGTRLGHQLRRTYEDYSTIMKANQQRFIGSAPSTATPLKVADEIADEVLETAITRLRAGEKFDAVRESLHISAERLRPALRRKYADFGALMTAHKKHYKQALVLPHAAVEVRQSPEPKRPKRPQYRPLRDVYAKQRLREEQARPAGAMAEQPRGHLRRMGEFSEQELNVLTVKLHGWIRDGVGRPVTTLHNWIAEA